MNTTNQNAFANDSVEATLRLIANLPAPKGLEDRINASLRTAQQSVPRKGRLLSWPGTKFRPGSDWMRSAAAAAIVLVVAGGGWGIYSHVQERCCAAARCRVSRILERRGHAYAEYAERACCDSPGDGKDAAGQESGSEAASQGQGCRGKQGRRSAHCACGEVEQILL